MPGLTNAAFATVIPNRYTPTSATSLANAITDVCSPTDALGFASSGIYLFWNIAEREVFYVGLAVDLGLRFKQHNGLAPCPEEACKRQQIEAHFSEHADLGYTALVQSTLDQAVCSAWEKAYPDQLKLIAEEFGYMDPEEAKELINSSLINGLRWMEGVLIRAFERKNGRRPKWNRSSGADIAYSDEDLSKGIELLKAVTLLKSDYLHLISHCSMGELSSNATHLEFEKFLHAARLSTRCGSSLKQTCEAMPDEFGLQYWPRMKDSGYLAKMPEV